MSDQIKHECGIGLIRLLKPLEYYEETYGSALWGLDRMFVLMEKQRNRGQDGAGLASLKLDVSPGRPYLHRERSNNHHGPWGDIFQKIDLAQADLKEKFPEDYKNAQFQHLNNPYAGEVLLGHLRYGTHGRNEIESCHPVVRTSDYRNRTLALAGNFNLTNVDELFNRLVELGQHPRIMTDTELMLERIAHYLDNRTDQLYKENKKKGHLRKEITGIISQELDMFEVIKGAADQWDGGYVFAGLVGNGDVFVVRDPNGIRPCFYYHNEEVLVAASERSAICTVFNVSPEDVLELPAAHVLTLKGGMQNEFERPAKIQVRQFTQPRKQLSCSFERIYFSRGNDRDIYQERKMLGKMLANTVLDSVNHDVDNTVFSYIPNTSEVSFIGLLEEMNDQLTLQKKEWIQQLGNTMTEKDLDRILSMHIRSEKVIQKDVKMRTFIADDNARQDLLTHVYDITRGVLNPETDNLVCVDDSIVRGSTLKGSILRMLARLTPKKIVIVSSAPQIRYPDCYGIDMSQIERLIAFQGATGLLRDTGQAKIIDDVYAEIMSLKAANKLETKNVVKAIYAPFSAEEISKKIAEIVKPDKGFTPELEIIFQPLENLKVALPHNLGDWYFSGDYPTPGGNRVVNQAFINYVEGKNQRAYQVGMG